MNVSNRTRVFDQRLIELSIRLQIIITLIKFFCKCSIVLFDYVGRKNPGGSHVKMRTDDRIFWVREFVCRSGTAKGVEI